MSADLAELWLIPAGVCLVFLCVFFIEKLVGRDL